jgi:hypothetical protein
MAAPPAGRQSLAASLLAIAFCSLVAALSARPGWSYLLFPELAALSTTVLQDPWGVWGRRPWQLVLLPALAGVAGLWISLHVSPTGVAVLLAVLAAKLLLLLVRSPLAPALSAAALPVILGLRSWAYPLQISLGLAAFTALLLLVRRARPQAAPPLAPSPPGHQRSGMLRWLAYLLPLLLIERLSGLHTLLLPPLIVISHEGLIDPAHCPWRGRSGWLLPLAFGTAAAIGLLSAHWLGHAPALATALSMSLCLLLLRRLHLHLPPVYAMAVLPQLLDDPGPRVLVGVILGASLLALLEWRCDGGAPPSSPLSSPSPSPV